MPEEIQPEQQGKSTRSYEEWKQSLEKIVAFKYDLPLYEVNMTDDKIKPYYDQGLMPTVAFNELFNK